MTNSRPQLSSLSVARTISIALALLWATSAASAWQDIKALQVACAKHDEGAALAALDVGATAKGLLSETDTAALTAIVDDQRAAGTVRVRCLQILLDRADQTTVESLANKASHWLGVFDAAALEHRTITAKEKVFQALVLTTLERAGQEGVKVWQHALRPMQELVRVAMRSNWGPAIGREARLALVRSPLTSVERTRMAIDYWKEVPKGSNSDSILYTHLDASLLPEISALVDQDAPLAWGPALALGHLGPAGSVEVLARFRERVRRVEGDVAADRWAGLIVEKARLQDPPASLVKYLATFAENERSELRIWAFERAVERGVPKDGLRVALMAYKGEWDRWNSDRNQRPAPPANGGVVHAISPTAHLVVLKARAVEHGVLSQADWADVKALPRLR